MAPNRFRQELGGGFINISDLAAGKIVSLDPNTKRATVFNMVNMPAGAKDKKPANHFDMLRERLRQVQADPDQNAEPLGEKELDGRTVVGFRFNVAPAPMTIWADAQTKLPYRIETTVLGPPRVEVVMTHYEFNVDLDESLFSLEIPTGYEEIPINVDASPPSEKDLITALRLCCEVSAGEFPQGLDTASTATYVVKYVKKLGVGKDGQRTADQMKQMMRIPRGFQFPSFLPANSDAHYAGAGAKSGQVERVVFWYKPAKSKKYRVLYADFSVRESETAPDVENAVKLPTMHISPTSGE